MLRPFQDVIVLSPMILNTVLYKTCSYGYICYILTKHCVRGRELAPPGSPEPNRQPFKQGLSLWKKCIYLFNFWEKNYFKHFNFFLKWFLGIYWDFRFFRHYWMYFGFFFLDFLDFDWFFYFILYLNFFFFLLKKDL